MLCVIPVLLNVSKQDSKYLFSVQVDFWTPGKAQVSSGK